MYRTKFNVIWSREIYHPKFSLIFQDVIRNMTVTYYFGIFIWHFGSLSVRVVLEDHGGWHTGGTVLIEQIELWGRYVHEGIMTLKLKVMQVVCL